MSTKFYFLFFLRASKFQGDVLYRRFCVAVLAGCRFLFQKLTKKISAKSRIYCLKYIFNKKFYKRKVDQEIGDRWICTLYLIKTDMYSHMSVGETKFLSNILKSSLLSLVSLVTPTWSEHLHGCHRIPGLESLVGVSGCCSLYRFYPKEGASRIVDGGVSLSFYHNLRAYNIWEFSLAPS
jgi:hypothetical protein